MASERSAIEGRLDELYREPPERFVAGRDALAKELRGAGEREAADRVRRLLRPSVAAWLINRVALDSPALLEEFAEASRAVEDAQRNALEGEAGAADRWRAAAVRERQASDAVAEAAETEALASGARVSKRALELVAATLRAAAADPELRRRVLAGRLEREQSGATIGISELPAGVAPGRRPAKAAKRREEAAARREFQELEDQLAGASERERRLAGIVDDAADALKRERAQLAEAKRETSALRRRLKAAKRLSA